ncbi:MAG: putative molybdenum carrier protein [Magnetococcales bacterium]|nr:putative molybdenum carrier protein [Magnetococcales bacterium]
MTKRIVKKVVSGGQTGVDRAALDVAARCGLSRGGWCPRGRLALDGPIPESYPLQETPSASYRQRTRWNVRDSDGTLIISRGVLKGGTALTHRLAVKLGKPTLILDLDYLEGRPEAAWDMLTDWIEAHQIAILNVAGPREQDKRGVYKKTYAFLKGYWDQPMGRGGGEVAVSSNLRAAPV